jgi:hypothetical protein
VQTFEFWTWEDFVKKLPVSKRSADRWLATGKLKVRIWQPAGPGGKRYVSVQEAERVLRAISGADGDGEKAAS